MGMTLSSTFAYNYNLFLAHAAVTGSTPEEETSHFLRRMRRLTLNDTSVEHFASGLRGGKKEILNLRDFVQHSPAADAGVHVPVLEGYTLDEQESEDMAVIATAANEDVGEHEYKLSSLDAFVAAMALLGHVISMGGVIRLRT